MKQRLLFSYIISEILPSFFIGLVIFISTLLSFQTLRITEFLLIHGIDMQNMFSLVGYLSIRFLPMILPMALLFSCLFTFNRLSNDSEIIALKASGFSSLQIGKPAMFFGLFIFLFSLYTTFYIGPWGAKSFDQLINTIGQTKASTNIKEESFSEGFFNMVVYANKVDSKTGGLADLFIYDERNPSNPLTIISKFGQIIQDEKQTDNFALLRLLDGEIHKSNDSNYTVVQFESYDINLSSPINNKDAQFNPETMNIKELNTRIEAFKKMPTINKNPNRKSEYIQVSREYHKRWALSFSCLIFTFLGIAIGIVNNTRHEKSNGYVISIGVLVAYWVLFIVGDQSVKSGKSPAYIGLWATNIIFIFYTYYKWKKVIKS